MDNTELSELESRINELKVAYENYFAGVEKREPLRKREALTAHIRRYDAVKLSTQLQFRLNTLRARYATLEQHWNRVVKQIEEGTFHKRRMKVMTPAASQAAPLAVEKPAAPSLEETAMRALYKTYSEMRAKAGEPNMSFDAMVSSLRKQVPMVIEKYKCKSVDFKVAQKDGKTIIRAVPIT